MSRSVTNSAPRGKAWRRLQGGALFRAAGWHLFRERARRRGRRASSPAPADLKKPPSSSRSSCQSSARVLENHFPRSCRDPPSASPSSASPPSSFPSYPSPCSSSSSFRGPFDFGLSWHRALEEHAEHDPNHGGARDHALSRALRRGWTRNKPDTHSRLTPTYPESLSPRVVRAVTKSWSGNGGSMSWRGERR